MKPMMPGAAQPMGSRPPLSSLMSPGGMGAQSVSRFGQSGMPPPLPLPSAPLGLGGQAPAPLNLAALGAQGAALTPMAPAETSRSPAPGPAQSSALALQIIKALEAGMFK